MKGVRAVLFDAGGTLIHMDAERVTRAVGLDHDTALFRRAETEAFAAVRGLVLANPASTDAERVPLYFDTLLAGLGFAEREERRAAAARSPPNTRARTSGPAVRTGPPRPWPP